jgi:hypothetical protein
VFVIRYWEVTDAYHVLVMDDAWKYLEAFSNTLLKQVDFGILYKHEKGFYYGWVHRPLPKYLNEATAIEHLGKEIKCKL